MNYSIIPLNVKCGDCREFNAQFQIVTYIINKKGKDYVKYRMLCSECAKNRILCLECEE